MPVTGGESLVPPADSPPPFDAWWEHDGKPPPEIPAVMDVPLRENPGSVETPTFGEPPTADEARRAFQQRIYDHDRGGPGLSVREQKAVNDAGLLWNLLCEIVGHGPSREGDLAELVVHIHAIQQAVMANAAARAHPDLYRPLGGDKPTVRFVRDG